MDKFGVFNLLGNLLSKFSTQSIEQSHETEQTPQKDTNQKQTNSTVPLPLQAGMINTMTNHDEFIKRVKQKNKI